MRAVLVDTVATIVFFTLAAGLVELFLVGMPLQKVLFTRAVMIPLMVVTGRPYGLWRDFVFARAAPRKMWTRSAVDVLAFLSFQVPIYAATLVLAGADPAEIATALGTAVILMVPLSRPFGLFLEAVRRIACPAVPPRHGGER